eukprot:497495_1
MRNTKLKNLSTDLMTADAKNYYGVTIPSESDINNNNIAILLDGIYTLKWRISNINTGLNDPNNYIEFEITLKIGTAISGWIGIGFGTGQYMQGKDIIKAMFERNTNGSGGGIFNIMDSYSPEWMPVSDTQWLNGVDNIFDFNGQFIDDLVIFNFKRPLIASDNWDYPINRGLEYFIIAYQLGCFECKHDTNHRLPGLVDWYTGSITTDLNNNFDIVRLYHGLTMIGLFGFAYPSSAFVARYLRHTLWWKYFHQQLASLGLMTSLTSAYFAISTTKTGTYSTHGTLGIVCVVLLCMQVTGGYCVNYWLENWKRNKWYNRVHYNHLIFAMSLNLLAPVALWYGWLTLKPYDLPGLEHLPVWYIYCVLLVIIGEIYRRYYPLWSSNSEYSAFDSNYHCFGWDEIGEKVSAGAAWIIIDKYVFDVTKWQFSHPGGRKILLNHIGTDCTKYFYGIDSVDGLQKYSHSEWAKKQMAHMIVGEVPPLTTVKQETTFKRNRQVSVQQTNNNNTNNQRFLPRNLSKYVSLLNTDSNINNNITNIQDINNNKTVEKK